MNYITVKEAAEKWGVPPARHYLSSCVWTYFRRCKKGKPLAYSRSRRKACGFAQGKEEALPFGRIIIRQEKVGYTRS